MIDWEVLAANLSSISVNTERIDGDRHVVSVSQAVRIELAPVRAEIERLRGNLRTARGQIKRAQFTKADFDAETERLVTGTAADAARKEE